MRYHSGNLTKYLKSDGRNMRARANGKGFALSITDSCYTGVIGLHIDTTSHMLHYRAYRHNDTKAPSGSEIAGACERVLCLALCMMLYLLSI